MVTQIVRIAPPNSLVYVVDDRIGEIPDDTGAGAVVTTPSCVMVGTLVDADGETEIRLSTPADFSKCPNLSLAWSGSIACAGVLVVLTSELLSLMSMELPGVDNATVDIWTNDDNEPDLIWVVVH